MGLRIKSGKRRALNQEARRAFSRGETTRTSATASALSKGSPVKAAKADRRVAKNAARRARKQGSSTETVKQARQRTTAAVKAARQERRTARKGRKTGGGSRASS